MNRKLSREEVVKIIYSMDINNSFDETVTKKHLENFPLESLDIEYLEKTTMFIINNLEKINELINSYSTDWKINRIAKVDLAILRTAIAEILFEKSIPSSVSINEAVEISKKYSNHDAHKFINGILGSVYRELDV